MGVDLGGRPGNRHCGRPGDMIGGTIGDKHRGRPVGRHAVTYGSTHEGRQNDCLEIECNKYGTNFFAGRHEGTHEGKHAGLYLKVTMHSIIN